MTTFDAPACNAAVAGRRNTVASEICSPGDGGPAWWPHQYTDLPRYALPVDWRAIHAQRREAGVKHVDAPRNAASYFQFDPPPIANKSTD